MKNILIVDDHSFVLEAYENLLRNIDNNKIENIYKVTSIENAISLINKNIQIDIAIFDISMPKNKLYDIDDGIDLALFFKAIHPFAKEVFYYNAYGFFHIIKRNTFNKARGLYFKN